MARRRNIKDVDCNCNIAEDTSEPESSTTNEHPTKSLFYRSWDYVDYHLLPTFLHDNEFLISGHRPELSSVTECLKSAFMLHSETWNIWTHLFGAVGSLILCIYYIFFVAHDWQHSLAFAVFFIGAVFCMGVSATYHALICHSEGICKFLAKLDYCGVIMLIVTSYVPWLHFAFYCQSAIKLAYLTSVFILGAIAVTFVIRDEFREPSYRWIRFGLFCSLGVSGVVPGVHSFLFHDILDVHGFPVWLVCTATLYIIGGFTYAIRVPERLFPGKFDIWCQSHQIMHVCVIGGVVTCYFGAAKLAFDRLQVNPDCLAMSLIV